MRMNIYRETEWEGWYHLRRNNCLVTAIKDPNRAAGAVVLVYPVEGTKREEMKEEKWKHNQLALPQYSSVHLRICHYIYNNIKIR